MKIADFGLARDVHNIDYYKKTTNVSVFMLFNCFCTCYNYTHSSCFGTVCPLTGTCDFTFLAGPNSSSSFSFSFLGLAGLVDSQAASAYSDSSTLHLFKPHPSLSFPRPLLSKQPMRKQVEGARALATNLNTLSQLYSHFPPLY